MPGRLRLPTGPMADSRAAGCAESATHAEAVLVIIYKSSVRVGQRRLRRVNDQAWRSSIFGVRSDNGWVWMSSDGGMQLDRPADTFGSVEDMQPIS